MANIVIQKSPLEGLLKDLPNLLLQYKQLQAQEEIALLEMEERKALRGQEIALKEYYSMKDEVQKTEDVISKYDKLPDSFSSQAGVELLGIVDDQNNIDMNAVTSNLNTLSSYHNEIKGELNELKGQAQTLKEMQSEFAGADQVMLPHEYEAFQEHALRSLEEGGLGWETTAGADVDYYKTDPSARFARALQITEKMKEDTFIPGAEGNYAIMQSLFIPGEGEDVDDLIERLSYEDASGKVIEPDENFITGMQQYIGQSQNYADFISNIESLPQKERDYVMQQFMGNENLAIVFSNLKRNVEAIETLDRELSGINEPIKDTLLDQFTSDIAGVTNKEVLFGLYDQYTSNLDPSDHEQFFNAIELQAGVPDLGDAYLEHKGFAGGFIEDAEAELAQMSPREEFDARLSWGGLFKQGTRGEEPMLKLAGGFLPVPNINWALERLEGEEVLRPDADIIDTQFAPTDRVNVALDHIGQLGPSSLSRLGLDPDFYQNLFEEQLESIGE